MPILPTNVCSKHLSYNNLSTTKISQICLYHVNLGKTLQRHYYHNPSPVSIVLHSESTMASFYRCLYKAGGKIYMVKNSGSEESHLTLRSVVVEQQMESLIQIDTQVKLLKECASARVLGTRNKCFLLSRLSSMVWLLIHRLPFFLYMPYVI